MQQIAITIREMGDNLQKEVLLSDLQHRLRHRPPPTSKRKRNRFFPKKAVMKAILGTTLLACSALTILTLAKGSLSSVTSTVAPAATAAPAPPHQSLARTY